MHRLWACLCVRIESTGYVICIVFMPMFSQVVHVLPGCPCVYVSMSMCRGQAMDMSP